MNNNEILPCIRCNHKAIIAKYGIYCPNYNCISCADTLIGKCSTIVGFNDSKKIKNFGDGRKPSTIQKIKDYLIEEWNTRNEVKDE